MNTDNTILALRAELERARAKFPKNDHLFAALGEEVGELARELLEGGTRERIRAEAIQVACVAVRIADEGDGDFPASAPDKAAGEPAEDAPCNFVSCIGDKCEHPRGSTVHRHGIDCGLDHILHPLCHAYVPPAPAPVEPAAPSVTELNAKYRAEWERYDGIEAPLPRCAFRDNDGAWLGALCDEAFVSPFHSHSGDPAYCTVGHKPNYACHPFTLPEEAK